MLRWLSLPVMLWAIPAPAQFSPGELSAVHADLEGITNCTRCHEVGAEISGLKCLSCHEEIKAAIGSGHGFHASTASQRCVDCHKEHLGRNAETILISRSEFDHSKTGFTLTGEHGKLRCEECHQPDHVQDEQVLAIMMEKGRASTLGLSSACSTCHADRHNGTLGFECQTCHSTDAWSPAVTFDHSTTSFPLIAEHSTVECSRCHTSVMADDQKIFQIAPDRFGDCTPCHASPHKRELGKSCRECHSPSGWAFVAASSFDHAATGFPLRGRHQPVTCDKCHGQKRAASSSITRICSDCHSDYHRREFAEDYNNDCSLCHDVNGFSPSTFTLAMHGGARFSLTGAHVATLCESCHEDSGGRMRFHFDSLECHSCHEDEHGGQFARAEGTVCADCHTTTSWDSPEFDHSTFPLEGKHSAAACSQCHKEVSRGGKLVTQFVETPSTCESCHESPHAGQFAAGKNTACVDCHSPEGWAAGKFNHDTQASFKLSGAHARVSCGGCHPSEEIGGTIVVRFRPIDTKCESCHAGRIPDGS